MLKKRLLKAAFRFGAFRPFRAAMRGKILFLTYHRFARDEHPLKICEKEFLLHLRHLKRVATVISMDEAVETIIDGRPAPPNAAVITIDDGYCDAYEIAFPLLRQFGFGATLFAVTGFVDGKCWMWTDLMRFALVETSLKKFEFKFRDGDAMAVDLDSHRQRLQTAGLVNQRLKRLSDDERQTTLDSIVDHLGVELPAKPVPDYAAISWDQAREMDAHGVRVESHSVTHPILTKVDESRLRSELEGSRSRLQDKLQRPVKYFCYPNGTYNGAVRTAVERAGYAAAVSTDYGFVSAKSDPLLLQRIDAPSAIENFAQSVSGFESFRLRLKGA